MFDGRRLGTVGEVVGMARHDVLGDQVAEDVHGAGPVGQRMEDLKSDAVAVVDHSEEQFAAIEVVEVVAERPVVGHDSWAQVALFQVVPEDASPQHGVVEHVLVEDPVEGLL